MTYGARYEFRHVDQHDVNYRDGTVIPHVEIEVYEDGAYRGYVQVHLHRVKDASISVGLTARWDTLRKP